jgi:hypothetical protein
MLPWMNIVGPGPRVVVCRFHFIWIRNQALYCTSMFYLRFLATVAACLGVSRTTLNYFVALAY